MVVACESFVKDNENFYEPIAVLGDVPEDLLGLLSGF
jgi:hypothetical protein